MPYFRYVQHRRRNIFFLARGTTDDFTPNRVYITQKRRCQNNHTFRFFLQRDLPVSKSVISANTPLSAEDVLSPPVAALSGLQPARSNTAIHKTANQIRCNLIISSRFLVLSSLLQYTEYGENTVSYITYKYVYIITQVTNNVNERDCYAGYTLRR